MLRGIVSPVKSIPCGYPIQNGNIHKSNITEIEQTVLFTRQAGVENEVINLKESWDERMGGFRRKKGKGE